MLKKDGIYFAYPRKSREDRDAEAYGGDQYTLERQEYILKDLANRYGIQISGWYPEVVSGETIADRPKMQQMLSDIETTRPNGVLVVEVERLSRGNPQDQGRVSDTFKFADTLIITPSKVYDLKNENDEEWLDFGLMRSRMEYRTIKRRLQNGRATSAMQGKYIGNIAPFGWLRKKLEHEKGFTLIPDPNTAWVVKLIYTMMDTGINETDYKPVGIALAARTLDSMGIKPQRGERWDPSVVSNIAQNPAHIGVTRYNHRPQVKTMQDGQIVKSRPVNNDCMMVPARWEGIIDKELFDRVGEKLKSHSSLPVRRGVKGSLAYLVRCNECGRTMSRRPKGERNHADSIMCKTYGCPTVGSYYALVEERLVSALDKRLEKFKISLGNNSANDWESMIDIKSQAETTIEREISALKKQLEKVHISFEQDIYDLPTYLERSSTLKTQVAEKEMVIARFRSEIDKLKESQRRQDEFTPYFEKVLNSYKESADPAYKNSLLKEIVEYVVYSKLDKGGRHHGNIDCFELDVHIRFKI